MSKLKGISKRELIEIEDEQSYLTKLSQEMKADLEEQIRETDEADYQEYLRDLGCEEFLEHQYEDRYWRDVDEGLFDTIEDWE